MAGAVMLGHLGVPTTGDAWSAIRDSELRDMLLLIDDMRQGWFPTVAASALAGELRRIVEGGWLGNDIGRADWATYLLVADRLEQEGY